MAVPYGIQFIGRDHVAKDEVPFLHKLRLIDTHDVGDS